MYSSKEQSKEKKQSTRDDIHPRAQSKWDELKSRGLIGNSTKTQPKSQPKPEQEDKESS